MIIGTIGIILLVGSYAVLLKTDKVFWEMNALASMFLLAHALMINDISFICVNSFISAVCIFKSIKNEFSIFKIRGV